MPSLGTRSAWPSRRGPPEPAAPARVIELETWGVPGSMAARFTGLKIDNPLVDAAVKGGLTKELTLTVDLDANPARWFEGLDAGPEIFFFRNNANDVAARILKA